MKKKSPAYSSDDTIAYVSISTGEAAHQSVLTLSLSSLLTFIHVCRDVLINESL